MSGVHHSCSYGGMLLATYFLIVFSCVSCWSFDPSWLLRVYSINRNVYGGRTSGYALASMLECIQMTSCNGVEKAELLSLTT